MRLNTSISRVELLHTPIDIYDVLFCKEFVNIISVRVGSCRRPVTNRKMFSFKDSRLIGYIKHKCLEPVNSIVNLYCTIIDVLEVSNTSINRLVLEASVSILPRDIITGKHYTHCVFNLDIATIVTDIGALCFLVS